MTLHLQGSERAAYEDTRLTLHRRPRGGLSIAITHDEVYSCGFGFIVIDEEAERQIVRFLEGMDDT